MDTQSLDVLEQKVNRIIYELNRCKKENLEMKHTINELTLAVNQKEKIVESLSEENMRLKDAQSDINSYRENQDRIKNKVESLLEKLKEFEDY